MNDDRTALRALAEEARRGFSEHPSPERLVAYREGRLSPEEEERLRDHLAVCRECGQLLLDLEGFSELGPAEGVPVPSDEDVAAAWRSVQARLGRGREQERAPRASLPYALAAVFFLTTVGLSLWVLLHRPAGNLSAQASANVPIVDLFPLGEGPRAGESAVKVVPPGGDRFLLLLHPRGEVTPPAYEAELVDVRSPGKVLLRAPGLVPREGGTLSLDLSRSAVPPGSYRLLLYGSGDGKRKKVAELEFEVAGPP